MRLVARLMFGVVVVLVLTGAALYLLRKPIAAAAVERVMAGARLEKPSVEVQDVNFSRLTLSRMTAGAEPSAPDLSLGPVIFEYGLRDLLFNSKLKIVSIEDGNLTAEVSDAGAFSIAGWSLDPNAKPAPPPFETVTIKQLAIVANTPKGPAQIKINGAFDMRSGGKFNGVVDAENAGFAVAALSRADGEAAIDLAADGAIGVAGLLKGDLLTPAGVARGADATMTAELSSWRGFFGEGPRGLKGAAGILIKSSTIDAQSADALSPILAAGGAPIKNLALSGAFKASFDGEDLSISLAENPLTIIADRGDRLVISGGEGPAYQKIAGKERLALSAVLEGPVAKGAATLNAASEDSGPWTIDAQTAFGEQEIGGALLSSFDGRFCGAYSEARATGDLEIATLLVRATVGRLAVSDMPVN